MENNFYNEQRQIQKIMDKTKMDIEIAYNTLNFVQDESLIDSVIYEIKSLTKKYEYYLKICKKNGITASGFDKIS